MNEGTIKGIIAAVVLAVLGGGYALASLETVAEGSVAVVYSTKGAEKEPLPSGWHFISPLKKTIEYPIRYQTLTTEQFNSPTSEGKSLTVEVNYQYLYEIKQMAIKEGFKYFTKVPWIKGDFKANTGRKSKNREDIMFFSKGEPRTLKLDAKKNIQLAKENDIDVKGLTSYEVKVRLEAHGLSVFYMKGTSGMLPSEFHSEVENFPFFRRSRTCKIQVGANVFQEVKYGYTGKSKPEFIQFVSKKLKI